MATTFTQAIRRPAAQPLVPRAVGEVQFRSLFAGRPLEKIADGKLLFSEGDPADHIFEIIEGVLRLYKLLPDGRRAIMGFMFPGEILGVSFKDQYLYSAEAVCEVKLQRYQRSQLHAALARAPGLSREVLAMACDELSAAQDQMLLLARKSAEEKLASFLLTVARRCSPDGRPAREFDLPMRRLDIADYLGLTIETVSRVLTKLKNEGLISLPSAHHVVASNMAKLRMAAGEEDAVTEAAPRMSRAVRPAVWPQ